MATAELRGRCIFNTVPFLFQDNSLITSIFMKEIVL